MGSIAADVVASDGEGPVRDVQVDAFRIESTTVTNARFEHFVAETGYVTDAERFGWSYVFHLARNPSSEIMPGAPLNAPWWVATRQANWRRPAGPGASPKSDHPVVHVSWNDAAAYAAWAGMRLPGEAEWEKAARGRAESSFPWGDELEPAGRHMCNVWQGEFPVRDTGEDGFAGPAPAKSFEPNGYGLFNVIGNVWEWCADWWSVDWHAGPRGETRNNPAGPPRGPGKVLRGGSHLCHASYCNRYRLSARTYSAPDMSASHTGFRCAR